MFKNSLKIKITLTEQVLLSYLIFLVIKTPTLESFWSLVFSFLNLDLLCDRNTDKVILRLRSINKSDDQSGTNKSASCSQKNVLIKGHH